MPYVLNTFYARSLVVLPANLFSDYAKFLSNSKGQPIQNPVIAAPPEITNYPSL
jgi:hypothetical protein